MPAPGLTKALEEAVLRGAKGAKVVRPIEKEIAKKEAEKAAAEAAAKGASDPAGAPAPVEVEPARVEPKLDAAPTAAADAAPEVKINVEPSVPDKAPPKPNAAELPAAPAEPAEQTARRLSRANLGDYALDDVSMPNFETITTTDDIKSVLADMSQKNASRIDIARRGKITNEQLKGLASELDVRESVVKQVLERETGGVLNPETILAARQVLNASADRLKTFADKIATGQATDVEKLQFARQIQFHNEYQTQFMGARAETGRALNAFRIPTGIDEATAARVGELIANSGGDIERMAKAIRMAKNTEGVTKIARSGIVRRSFDAAGNFVNRNFVNGILSGPVTHFVNMTGNSIFQAMNAGEIALAARLGQFLPGEEHVAVGEALANLHGTLGATQDAWRMFGRALKTGQSLDGILKYDTGKVGDTLSHLPELNKPYIGRVISGLDAAIGLPTRVLGAEDDLFKTLAYRAYVERQAMRHVQDQFAAGTLKLEDAEAAAREFMENTPEETAKAAEEWASDVTFQTPLGATGQAAQRLLRKVPGGTLIAPFVRTPVNIFKQSAYRSPLAVFSQKFWSDVKAGGSKRDLALTRFALGSGTAALVAKYAADGKLTGSGPQNPKARELWLAQGNKPYSIRVENPVTGEATWHSYARMEPFASIVGATADAVEIGSYVNSDPESLTDQDAQLAAAAGAIIAGIMNNTGNKTFLKGVSDFMELLNDPAREIGNYSKQMISAQVPYSSLLRTIRNFDDPYLRESWTITDKLKDNTPGYSKDLPLRLDVFGEPREKNHSTLLGAMSPIPETKTKDDPVIAELVDVMNQTHQVPSTMPDKRVEGMALNSQEYADLTRIARSEPIMGGRTYHDVLERTIASSVYQRATPLMRVELLKKVQSNADSIARAKLEKENPDFAERITEWRMQKQRLLFNK